jgi:hypothetical protein
MPRHPPSLPHLNQEGRFGEIQVRLPSVQGNLHPIQLIQVVLQRGRDVDVPIPRQVADGVGGEEGGRREGGKKGGRKGRRGTEGVNGRSNGPVTLQGHEARRLLSERPVYKASFLSLRSYFFLCHGLDCAECLIPSKHVPSTYRMGCSKWEKRASSLSPMLVLRVAWVCVVMYSRERKD